MRKMAASALALLTAAVAAGGPPVPGRGARILSPTFFPGWQARNVSHPFVLYDRATGLYRMYYTGSGTIQINDSVSDQWVTGLVTSKDGLAWEYPEDYEPVLLARRFLEGDVVDRDEQSAVFDSMFASGACVVRDGAAWRMWYAGWNGDTEQHGGGVVERVHFRIGHATSRDGVAWTKRAGAAGGGAVLGLGEAGEPDARSAAHPHVLKEGALYRMWYEGYDGNAWRICHATSADGIAWRKRGAVLEPGGSGAMDELGARNPVVIARKGRYELWYQGRSRSQPSLRVLRATSRDGISWTKVSEEVVLHPDAAPAGDEAIAVDSILVNPDGSCRVFFGKETTTRKAARWGEVSSKSFHIYTETVDP